MLWPMKRLTQVVRFDKNDIICATLQSLEAPFLFESRRLQLCHFLLQCLFNILLSLIFLTAASIIILQLWAWKWHFFFVFFFCKVKTFKLLKPFVHPLRCGWTHLLGPIQLVGVLIEQIEGLSCALPLVHIACDENPLHAHLQLPGALPPLAVVAGHIPLLVPFPRVVCYGRHVGSRVYTGQNAGLPPCCGDFASTFFGR